MHYQLSFEPFLKRPRTQSAGLGSLTGLFQQLGSNFSFSTLLLVGACLQSLGVLVLLPSTRAIYLTLPAFLLLGTRIIDAVLIHAEFRSNPYLKQVYKGRSTALVPDENGVLDESNPCAQKVAVLLLGAKSNHPFGIFAPQFVEMGNWFRKMSMQFDSERPPKGFLGQVNYQRKDERGARELCFVSYWRSIEDLHEFAHSPLHRDAWRWWEQTLKEHDMLGISHEIYEAPARSWESVYANCQPTGLGATRFAREREGEEGTEWFHPLVDARRGKLSKSSYRLGREETKFDKDRPAREKYAWGMDLAMEDHA